MNATTFELQGGASSLFLAVANDILLLLLLLLLALQLLLHDTRRRSAGLWAVETGAFIAWQCSAAPGVTNGTGHGHHPAAVLLELRLR